MVVLVVCFSGSFDVCLVHAQVPILVPLKLPLKLPLSGTGKTVLGFHDYAAFTYEAAPILNFGFADHKSEQKIYRRGRKKWKFRKMQKAGNLKGVFSICFACFRHVAHQNYN